MTAEIKRPKKVDHLLCRCHSIDLRKIVGECDFCGKKLSQLYRYKNSPIEVHYAYICSRHMAEYREYFYETEPLEGK